MPRIGLDKLHVAILNQDGTYGTPVNIAKSIEANISPNVNTNTFYADDAAQETNSTVSDFAVEFNIDDLSTEAYTLLLGKTANADGVIIDNVSDEPPYLALGFRSKKSNGKYRYIWLYKGKFQLPEETYATQGENIEYQTQTITGRFVADDNGNFRARVDEDAAGVNQTVIQNWFTAVYTT